MSASTSPADVEREAIVAALLYDECRDAFAKLMRAEYFSDSRYAAMAGEILDQLNSGDGFDPATAARNLKAHPAFPGGNDDVVSLIQDLSAEYASRAQFPHKCAQIVEASRKRDQLLDIHRLQDEARNGSTSAEICRATLETVARWKERAAGFGRRDRFTLAELRTAFPTLNPPVVDGLLRRGETANIISVSKIGKSWLGYSLALSQITRRPWLDHFATSGGKVLLVDNELHASTLAYRIPVVGNAMGIQQDEYDQDLEVWPLRGRLRSLSELSIEFDALEPGQFSIILLDAKYRFATAGVSENENSSEAAFYNEVDRLAERTGAAIVLIHHSSKGSQSDKRVTDVGSGAGSQSRAADAHLILREHEEDGVCVFDAAVRSFAPIEPLALRWTFPLWLPTEADPSRLKRAQTPAERLKTNRDKEAVDKIVAALLRGEATIRQLREQTGLSRERIESRLDLLTAEDQVTYSETTKRGNPCRVYRLKDQSDN